MHRSSMVYKQTVLNKYFGEKNLFSDLVKLWTCSLEEMLLRTLNVVMMDVSYKHTAFHFTRC